MPSYIKRQSKTKGQVWDVVFRVSVGEKDVQKKLSGYRTKKDAQRAYEDFTEAERLKPVYAVPTRSKSSTSFVNAFNAFMEARQGQLSPHYIYTTSNTFKRYILPFFAEKQIDEITRADIASWRDGLWDKKKQNGDLLCQRTCVWVFDKFRLFMQWAADRYSLIANPFDGVKKLKRREQKKEMQVWSAEQFAKFLGQVDDEKYKMFFTLLFFTGCRRGEINALTAEDFIKKDGHYTIKISKSVGYQKGRGMVVTPPKTPSSNRTVSLPEGITPMLDTFLEGKTRYIWNLYDSYIDAAFKRALDKTNLPHIRIHDLRHSHASILIANGIPVTTVSKRLGHSNVEMTLNVYSHAFESSDADVLNVLENLKD